MLKRLALLFSSLSLFVFFIGLFVASSLPKIAIYEFEIPLATTPSKAWEAVMDFSSYPRTRRDIAKIDKLVTPNVGLSWRETTKDKKQSTWQLIDAKPGEHAVFQRTDSDTSERRIYSIRATHGSTVMHLCIRKTLTNPLTRLFDWLAASQAQPAETLATSFQSSW